MNKTAKLVVSDIPKTLFVIPYYQRGYRWTGKNVKQLLSDLLLFANDHSSEDSEYCLQPIVLQCIPIKEYSGILNNEEIVVRVVDGQQRLTTIAIILRKLGIDIFWDIYYDTEKKRLSDILSGETRLSSINDYFRQEVSNAIDEWLLVHPLNDQEAIKKLFSSKDKTIAFLEYDIDTPEDKESNKEGHEAFRRLNDGKTPLTASELIRALYMVRSSGLSIQQQMEISKEWEMIEKCLRDNQFWLMFNAFGLEDTPTRIDLLFALVLEVDLKETKANPRKVFDELEDDEKSYDLEKVWDEVLQTFWWMQSCYSDNELCNYLSWIRAYTDNSASTIYRIWRENPIHKEFKKCIIGIIQETKFGGNKINSLDSVDYNWDRGELRKLFVLLNVLDCNKSHERFRFDLFNKCKGWDIEHIDSQTPNEFKEDKNKREWLSAAWKELTKEQKNRFLNRFDPQKSFDTFDIDGVDYNNFGLMADFIVELTQDYDDKIPSDKTNKLGNLALLNLSINRSYHNDIFPLKRKAIIENVNNGTDFIPPCTVKAFSKFYTKSASKITSWQNSDYEGYYNVMNSWFYEFMNFEVTISDRQKKSKKNSLRKEVQDNIESEQGNRQITGSQKKDIPRFQEPINFLDLMDNYDVIIPKIQRLYVQGRLDKHGEKCLSGFASQLVGSVSESSPLLLDFVYGIDTTSNSRYRFYPLDGQQRLTTLLLLSWLCGLSKIEWTFRYESRRATEIFIKGLLASDPPQIIKPYNYNELKKEAKNCKKNYPSLCKDYIRNLPWFHESWLCDAGICGMLEMLDSLYDKLLNIPKKDVFSMDSIVFLLNYLDVNKKSYDHIFLKMNSRGRELTGWDNVNAVLDEYLPESLKGVWPEKIQLWYELMWKKTLSAGIKDTDKIDRVDAQMLKVIELALDCSGYEDKCTNTYELSIWLQRTDKKYFYELCQIFFSALEKTDDDDLTHLIPNWSISQRPRIPDFACKENEVIRLYQPLLAFYASEKSKDVNWMRVIWNLVENIDVERASFKQAIHLIEELANNKDSILSYLANCNTNEIKLCYQKASPQLLEEIDKAKQIINNSDNVRPEDWDETKLGEWTGWYDVIISAESNRYFAGAIRFLYHDGQHIDKWSTFCTKWIHADCYFDDNGIRDEYVAKLISALLKRCTKWEQIHDQFIFNKKEWKWRVLLNPLFSEPLDYVLESPTLDNKDVKAAKFEEGLVCEGNLRDRLCEEKLLSIITTNYCDCRLSYNRYFYGWRKHDGILFDWTTKKDVPESWERRRNMQIKDLLSVSEEIVIINTHIIEEIYYGYTLIFKYKNKYCFVWPDNNIIYIRENDQQQEFLKVTPNMDGKSILCALDQQIQDYNLVHD